MRRALALLMVPAALAAGCSEPQDEDERGGVEIPASLRWTAIARTLGGPEDPRSANVCNRGEQRCLAEVVREMTRRYDRLKAVCDHRAAFALMYLRVTERVADAGTRTFRHREYLNHLDAVFADLYFSAFDRYAAGQEERVPAAWQVAFRAAEARTVSGLGDMLLGMNAHISRDLPFALARIGLVAADGRSGRPDYDRVNRLLADVQAPMLAEASARLDPTIKDYRLPALDFSSADVADLIATWRSEAWRNAQALTLARSGARRDAVVERIEENAESRARVLEAATSYVLTGGTTAARDAYCASR